MPRRDAVKKYRVVPDGVPRLNEHLDGRIWQKVVVDRFPGWTVDAAIDATTGDLVGVHLEAPVPHAPYHLTTRRLRDLPLGEIHHRCLEAASAGLLRPGRLDRLSPGMVDASEAAGRRLREKAAPSAPKGGRHPLTPLDKATFARDFFEQVVRGHQTVADFAKDRHLSANTVSSRAWQLRQPPKDDPDGEGYLTRDEPGSRQRGQPYGELTEKAKRILREEG